MRVDRQEAFRYMKMGSTAPDGELMRRFEEIERELLAVVRPKSVHRLLPIGELRFDSADLRRHLQGCDRAFVLAVTLGVEIDAALRRFAARGAVDGLIADAIATSLVESAADDEMAVLSSEVPDGELTARFSPGYGDLPLAVQPDLLDLLSAGRRIGLALTDSLLMVPSKSVSAIVGVCPRGGVKA